MVMQSRPEDFCSTVKNIHNSLIESNKLVEAAEDYSVCSDAVLVCQNGSFNYSRLLLKLLLPTFESILKESDYYGPCCCEKMTIIYPDYDVDELKQKLSCKFEIRDSPIENNLHEDEEDTLLSGNLEESCSTVHVEVNETIFEEQSTMCDMCGSVFNSQRLLKRHQEYSHTPRSKKFICKVCNKGFEYDWKLTRHKMKHSDPQFICSICQSSFKYKNNLVQHYIKFHDKVGNVGTQKFFKCDFCELQFDKKSNLNRHHKTKHTLSKFECPTCRKVFNRKDNFSRHILLHNTY